MLDENALERMIREQRAMDRQDSGPAETTKIDETAEFEVYERAEPRPESQPGIHPEGEAPAAAPAVEEFEELPGRDGPPAESRAATPATPTPPTPTAPTPPSPTAPTPPTPTAPTPPGPAAPPAAPTPALPRPPAPAPPRPAEHHATPPQGASPTPAGPTAQGSVMERAMGGPIPVPKTEAPAPSPPAPSPAASPPAPSAAPAVAATPKGPGLFRPAPGGATIRIAIVQADFNRELTDVMAQWAHHQAKELGAEVTHHLHVAGAYDLPLTARRAARREDVDAVVVLGAIVQGETGHDELIARECARKMADLAWETGKPVGFGVTGPRMSWAQAQARVTAGQHAVTAAVQQVRTLRQLTA